MSETYKRAVGYCGQSECEHFLKGTFLLNHGDVYFCEHCRWRGWIEKERKVDHAPVDAIDPIYHKVRVHFDFDPTARKYKQIAEVYVPELIAGFTFEIYNPLIKTEKRALNVGESSLCALNSGNRDGEMLETSLSFDRADWAEQVKKLEQVIDDRDRRVYAHTEDAS